MSFNDQPAPPGAGFSIQDVGGRVGAFVVMYDPYYVESARRQIAQFDAARVIDAPDAKIVVVVPTIRQHLQSGSPVDLDVLRHNVDVVCVYDSESAKRLSRALKDANVRVVVLPPPRMRDITHHDDMPENRRIANMAALLQAIYDMSPAEARRRAADINAKREAEKLQQNPNKPRP